MRTRSVLHALVSVVVLAAVVSTSVLAAPPAAAAGSPDLTLLKVMDPNTLLGDVTEVSLTVTNSSGTDGYNLSFNDVLPEGVSWASGSPAPSQIINDAPTLGETTLIWENYSDIPDGSTQTITYQLSHNTGLVSVGDTLGGQAGAYANTDPRFVPDFDPVTGVANGDFTGSGTASDTTDIVPFRVVKTEASEEAELLRGAHDHQTIYTITVDNNLINASTGFQVEDHLPAGLEFLECGTADNSTAEEYPGAGVLNPGNAPTITTGVREGCVTPSSVDTVNTDPDGPGPLPTGIYTHVVWDAAALVAAFGSADLAAAQSMVLHYVAAIPANANTLTWPAGAPAAASGLQGSNLDNNTGPSTEETSEQQFTNYALGTAVYTGDAQSYTSDDTETVSSEDVSIHKGVDDQNITQGQTSGWTLTVESSEYVTTVDQIVVTDTVPDGLCPTGTGTTEGTVECDFGGEPEPSHPYTSATENADGTWTLVWDFDTTAGLGPMSRSETRVITFDTITRAFYQEGGADDLPVVAEDAWSNVSDLTASADGRAVTDTSFAAQEAGTLTILKEVALPGGAPYTCGDGTSLTWDANQAGSFVPGDRVCWRLTVTFPGQLDTLSSQITDFLPAGYTYESYSLTPVNTVAVGEISFDGTGAAQGALIWNLGDPGGYVDVGEFFQVVVSTVISDPLAARATDLTENLMKFSFVNTTGELFPLRDDADAGWSEPELTLTKGVAEVVRGVTTVEGPNGPDVDNVSVEGGDIVTYRVDIANGGDIQASNTTIWDILPSQIGCGDVSSISNSGTCNGAEDRVEWTAIDVAAAASVSLTYDVTIPAVVGPNETLTNTAGVRDYETPTNVGVGTTFTYLPQNNIDSTVVANTDAADDTSVVHTGTVTIDKLNTTEHSSGGNNTGNEAAIGEEVTFTVSVDIPPGTTLEGPATLVDNLDAGLTYIAASASGTLNGVALPTGGVSVSDAGGNIVVTFPDPYTNTTGVDTLIVSFDAQVEDDAGNVRNATIPNVATFSWTSSITGAQSVNDNVNTSVVEPNLTLVKTHDAAGAVLPGQAVSYDVVVTNDDTPARVSTAYDIVVVDTLPADVTPTDGGVPVTDGGNVPPDSGIWDDTLRTITWTLASLDPAASTTLDYDAVLADPLVAGSALTNNVAVAASSLPSPLDSEGERDDTSPNGGPGSGYQATSDATLQAQTPSVTKTVLPTDVTVGDDVQYTIDVTIPGGIVAYDVAVRDDLPVGLEFDGTASIACDEGGGACLPAITTTEIGTIGTQVASWWLGDLTAPAAGDRVVTITFDAHVVDDVSVTASSTLDNSAVVMSNLTDKTVGTPGSPPAAGTYDDVSTAAVASLAIDEPTLTIDKDVSGQNADDDNRRVLPGEVVTYTLLITNTGDGDANDIVVSDAVDPRMIASSIVSGSDSGVAYTVTDGDPSDGTLGWAAAGPLAPLASFTISYDLQVPALTSADEVDPGFELTNVADVSEYWGAPLSERLSSGNTYRNYDDVTSDQVDLEVDLASIGDLVWFDRDGDGVQDGDEPGLDAVGVTVTYLGLDDAPGGGDDEVFNATTDSSGAWLVSNLPDGEYTVVVASGDLPSGMVPSFDLDGGTATPDGQWTGSLGAAEDKRDADFGFEGQSSLGDRVFFDRDADGTVDGDEFGLEGVGVTVTWFGPDDTLGGGDDVPFATTTDSTGVYTVGGLPGGNYSVVVTTGDLPPGMSATYDLDGGTATPDSSWSGALGDTEAKVDVDFGYAGSGSIGDHVWLDDNADGVRDGGEQPLVGVQVQLTWAGEDGVLGNVDDDVYVDMTDGSGIYLFAGLPPGDYVVDVVGGLPIAATNTYDEDSDLDDSTDVTLADGAAHLGADFGYQGTTGIGDLVWYDLNGDGVQDVGEPGIEGVELTLTYAGADDTFGTLDDVTLVETTDASGAWFFANLPAGDHEVAVTGGVPAGMTPTYDEDADNDEHTLVAGLVDGVPHLTADFGYTGTGSVGDFVWLDLNGDGIQDAGEPPLAGVDVTLTWVGVDGLSGTGDDVMVTVTTGIAGDYTVVNLPAGDMVVTVDDTTLPAAMAPTWDVDLTPDHTTSFTLGSGEGRADVDFGYQGAGSIGDVVWLDNNADGVVDEGELGIEGVTVDLAWAGVDGVFSTPDDQGLTTVTDASGMYSFAGLADGDYTVTVQPGTLPTGLAQSHDETGGIDHSSDVTLVGGAEHDSADFGYVGAGSIGDFVWLDVNGDGVQDLGEPALPGVDVQLTWAGEDATLGTPDDNVQVVTTGPGGEYLFEGLPPGDHVIEVIGSLPSAGTNTFDEDSDLDGSTDVSLADGVDHLTADFGYSGDNSIGDLVWFDIDGDGVQDSGEPGIGDVHITVTWHGGDGVLGGGDDVSFATVTDAGGSYLVDGLLDGAYSVAVTAGVPDGYRATFDSDGPDGEPDEMSVNLSLSGGVIDGVHDFGYTGTSSIDSLLWLDLDGNEIVDEGEPGLTGIVITVTWHGPDGVPGGGDDVVYPVVTDGGGGYLAGDLPPGSYTIDVPIADLPAGVVPSADPDGGDDNTSSLLIAPGELVDDQDFGYQGPGTIGDIVYIDADGDGVFDPDEEGLGGLTVTIVWLGPDGEPGGGDDMEFIVVTDPDGSYELSGLPEGRYTVTLTAPDSADVEPDSDLDGGDPASSIVELNPGQTQVDVDFGLVGTAELQCQAFADTNGNGVADSGETGIAGAEVSLTNSDGVVVRTMTTTADGQIRFDDLAPGTYTLSIDVPSQYGSIADQTVTTAADGHDCRAFGAVIGGGLGRTGAESWLLALIGLALLGAGAALFLGLRYTERTTPDGAI